MTLDDAICPVDDCYWRCPPCDLTAPLGQELRLRRLVDEFARAAARRHATSHSTEQFLAVIEDRRAELDKLAEAVRSGAGLTVGKPNEWDEDQLVAVS
jgi:hypothetical protein